MIELRDLTKCFPGPGGDVPVLRGVSLSVRRGEIFGVIGKSGAGKSTLIRCVNVLERPTSGEVWVGGREISALSGGALREARREMGMVFQHFNLLASRTAFHNVCLPLELAGVPRAKCAAQALPLLELVGLADKRDRYPAELSGGEKQRVGIARALASRPQVLLCDEATSALDPETTKSILALLRDVSSRLGLTVLLITHEMEVIRSVCHRVAVLDGGVVAEEGKVFDVFTAPRTPVARAFVRDLIDRELPPDLRERLRGAPGLGLRPVLRIVFTGPGAREPVLSEAVRRFGVLFNLLQGSFDHIQGAAYGNVVAEVIGEERAVAGAVEWLRGKELGVEVLGHVDADARAVA